MISCIIIEDQPLAQRILKKYIEETKELILLGVFQDAIKASSFLETNEVELIFLDIHLPQLSGLDFLKATPNHPKVILTTAFTEYALESYQFNVIDYLLKPYTFERFSQAIQKLQLMLPTEKKNPYETVIIKSGHEFVQISARELVFIKSDGDYTELVTTSKTYLSKESLKDWLKELDNSKFCQIHRSFIINIGHFKRITGNTVHLSTTSVPIGRVFKKDFISNYLK